MWGGFDLGNISHLGNQLGEALQRAKHEIDAKLDQTFTFEDKPARRSSDSTHHDDEQFTVDVSGQLISTGRPASKQPATEQKGVAGSQQQQHQAKTATPSAAPDSSEQNGHARQPSQLPTSSQSRPGKAEAAAVEPVASAAADMGAQSINSRPVQRKVVKQLARTSNAEGQDTPAAADYEQQQREQERLPATGPTSTARSSEGAAADEETAAAVSSSKQLEAAAAADMPTMGAAAANQATTTQQQHRSPKQKKGLGVVRLGQQQQHPQKDAAQQQQPAQQVSSSEALLQEPQHREQRQQGIQHVTQHQPQPMQHGEQQQAEQGSSQHPGALPKQQPQQQPEQHLQDHLQPHDEQLSGLDDNSSAGIITAAALQPDSGIPSSQHSQLHKQEQEDMVQLQQQEEVQQQEPVSQDSADGWVEANDLAQDLAATQQPKQQSQQLQQHPPQQQPLQQQHSEGGPPVSVTMPEPGWLGSDSAQQRPLQHHTDTQQFQQDHTLLHTDQQQHHDQRFTDLQQQLEQLQQQLMLREGQLARQAQRSGDLEAANTALSDSKAQLEQVVAALTAKNEQLAMRASKVNEQELEEVQREAAERLAAAERKVFALIKERDALKRATATATAGGDGSSDARKLEAELKKKDDLAGQLMEEGQKLSKRQLELESAVKKLRQQVKASDAEKEKLNALLAAERAECESLRKAKTKAERDLAAAIESGRQELEAVKQQGEEQLLKAQADKATAEASAAEAATEGISGQLAASEAQAAALAESVSELQEALDGLRAAASVREEMLRQDIADLERRAQAAELRHQELSSKLPEATAPLLRQITSLQEASTAQAQAWAAAERSLMARVHEAEAVAEAVAERERLAQEAVVQLQARVTGAESTATAAKASAVEAAGRAARANERLALEEQQLEDAQAAAEASQSEVSQLREELKQQEQAHRRKLSNESAAKRAAEEELLRTRQELSQLQGLMGSGFGAVAALQAPQSPGGLSHAPSQQTSDMWRTSAGPPALAAPGFKWILVREGSEEAAAVAAAADGDDGASSVPGTPHSAASAGGAASKLLGRGSTASSVLGPRFFDTHELLQSDAASALGAGSAGGLTPTSSNAQQLHQAQLRAAQQRLGGGSVGEAQLQRFRAALKQKIGECAALEARVRELEETRDQLAGELLRATQEAQKASDAVMELPKLQQSLKEVEARYAAAVELVGERDEQLEEMANDLEDVKQLYRQQIETLLAQMAQT